MDEKLETKVLEIGRSEIERKKGRENHKKSPQYQTIFSLKKYNNLF